MDPVQTPNAKIIDDKYWLQEQLGEGASAVVFRATHTLLGTQLAVKLIKQTFVEEAGLRLKTEAQILAQLQHKNIVRLFHCGFTADKTPYMAFEFADGISLRSRLQNGPKLTPDEIAEIITQALEDLGYAHKLGFVHRDLKPENIMLCDVDGKRVVKLLDFGLAKILPNAQLKAQHATQTGMVVGSPMYMSPEQCISSDIDSRSDLYSLGCVLFEMLAGHTPFYSDSPNGIIIQHHRAPVPSLSLADDASNKERGLAAIATNCLQKEPGNRYQSAEKMRSALSDVCGGDLIPQSTAQRVFEPHRALGAQPFFIAVVALGLASAAIIFWSSGPQRIHPSNLVLGSDAYAQRKGLLDTIFTEEKNRTTDPQIILAKLEQWRADNPRPKIPISAYSANEIRMERLRLLNLGISRKQCCRLNKSHEAHDYAQLILDQVELLSSVGFVDEATCHAILCMVLDLKESNLSQRLEDTLEKLSRCSILRQKDDSTKQSITLELANMYLLPSRITEPRIAKAKHLLANQLKQVVPNTNRPLHNSVKQLLDLLNIADPVQYIRCAKSITVNTVIQAAALAKRYQSQGDAKRQIALLTALSQASIESKSKSEIAHYHEVSIVNLVDAINAELQSANGNAKDEQATIDEAINSLSAIRQSFSNRPSPSAAHRFDADNTLALAYQIKGKFTDPTLLQKASDITIEGFRRTEAEAPATAVRYNQKSAEIFINGNKTKEALSTLRAAEDLVPRASIETLINRCDYYRALGLAFCAKNDAANASMCLDYCLQPDRIRLCLNKDTRNVKANLLSLALKTSALDPTNQHAKEQVKACLAF